MSQVAIAGRIGFAVLGQSVAGKLTHGHQQPEGGRLAHRTRKDPHQVLIHQPLHDVQRLDP